MIDDNNIQTFNLTIIVLCGLIGILFYIVYVRKRLNDDIKGYSLKYHKFVWCFLLISWSISSMLDYILYQETLNIFPFSVIMFMEFLYSIGYIATFIGFFKFKKWSFYTLEISCVLSLLAQILLAISFVSLDIEINTASIIASLTITIPTMVYYYKRKELFSIDKIKIDRKAIFNDEIKFCKYCGNKLNSEMKYCNKCGNSIERG